MLAAFIEEAWKPILIVLCALMLWVFVRIEDAHIAKLQAYNQQLMQQVTAANKEIEQQNAAIDALKAAGQVQQARIDTLARAGQQQAEKVVVQWKTKLVAVPVPAECSAAVAAGAENAASVAQLYSSSTP